MTPNDELRTGNGGVVKYKHGWQIRVELFSYIEPARGEKETRAHYAEGYSYHQIPAATRAEAEEIVEAMNKAAQRVRSTHETF